MKSVRSLKSPVALRTFSYHKIEGMKARFILSVVLSATVALWLASCQEDIPVPDVEEPMAGFDKNGASLAVFSVAEGHTVRFSRGNLQHQPSTGCWRFAENQYDTIGGDNVAFYDLAYGYIPSVSTYSGWIDLFSFYVEGSGLDVSSYYNSKNTDMPEDTTNIDWAWHNAIQNGGDKAYFWRTMTKDEWMYLLQGRPNAASRCGDATVNGVNGLVILPDEWISPSQHVFTPGFHNYGGVNVYTAEEWLTMQEAGAIFLPAEGLFNGENLYAAREWGCYWTSTAVYYAQEHKYYANHLIFNGYGTISPGVVYCALNGYAVRPVLDEKQD